MNNKKQLTFKTFQQYCKHRWAEMADGDGIFVACGDWLNRDKQKKCNQKNCQPWKGFRNVKN